MVSGALFNRFPKKRRNMARILDNYDACTRFEPSMMVHVFLFAKHDDTCPS